MPSIPSSDEIASIPTISKASLYEVLGVSSNSSQAEIREAYRRKSKMYHPDTAVIQKEEAAVRFQKIQQAYETLRFPDTRKRYDLSLAAAQPLPRPSAKAKSAPAKATSNLELEERPLSSGEIFALFILVLTFFFCLFIALFVGISRGEVMVQSLPNDSSLMHQLNSVMSSQKREDLLPLSSARPAQQNNGQTRRQ